MTADAFTLLEGLCKQATLEKWRDILAQSALSIREQALLVSFGDGDDYKQLDALGDAVEALSAYIAALAPETVLAMIETLRRADAALETSLGYLAEQGADYDASRASLESLLSKGSL